MTTPEWERDARECETDWAAIDAQQEQLTAEALGLIGNLDDAANAVYSDYAAEGNVPPQAFAHLRRLQELRQRACLRFIRRGGDPYGE